MHEGYLILIALIVLFLMFHVPIYVWHRSNRKRNMPPNPAIAFILSFVPSPIGGILYVNGLLGAVPCLVVLIAVFSKVPGRDAEAYMLGYSIVIMAVSSTCSALITRISIKLIATREATKSMN